MSRSAELRALPKVLLHDHLDGGLRATTILELADEVGYSGLPASDPEALTQWFHRGADRRRLELYLETFEQTVAVMQTADAIERVAYEAVADLAAEGVVYAELRYAPELSLNDALGWDDVLEAMTSGLARGERDHGCVSRAIVAALRHLDQSVPAAEAAVRWVDRGVVGFDLAGPEDGYPVEDHIRACLVAEQGGVAVTLHAGEAHGPPSIEQALELGGASRIGHGVRIIDDVEPDGGLGPVARRVHDGRVPLEICPTSNVHTGVVDRVADHPIDRLRRLGFAVTLNTDNRLMSGVTPTSEFEAVADAFGWTPGDFHDVTLTALDAAFVDDTTRNALQAVVEAGYAADPEHEDGT